MSAVNNISVRSIKVADTETATLRGEAIFDWHQTLFQYIHQISKNISEQSHSTITKVLIFVDNKLDFEL